MKDDVNEETTKTSRLQNKKVDEVSSRAERRRNVTNDNDSNVKGTETNKSRTNDRLDITDDKLVSHSQKNENQDEKMNFHVNVKTEIDNKIEECVTEQVTTKEHRIDKQQQEVDVKTTEYTRKKIDGETKRSTNTTLPGNDSVSKDKLVETEKNVSKLSVSTGNSDPKKGHIEVKTSFAGEEIKKHVKSDATPHIDAVDAKTKPHARKTTDSKNLNLRDKFERKTNTRPVSVGNFKSKFENQQKQRPVSAANFSTKVETNVKKPAVLTESPAKEKITEIKKEATKPEVSKENMTEIKKEATKPEVTKEKITEIKKEAAKPEVAKEKITEIKKEANKPEVTKEKITEIKKEEATKPEVDLSKNKYERQTNKNKHERTTTKTNTRPVSVGNFKSKFENQKLEKVEKKDIVKSKTETCENTDKVTVKNEGNATQTVLNKTVSKKENIDFKDGIKKTTVTTKTTVTKDPTFQETTETTVEVTDSLQTNSEKVTTVTEMKSADRTYTQKTTQTKIETKKGLTKTEAKKGMFFFNSFITYLF